MPEFSLLKHLFSQPLLLRAASFLDYFFSDPLLLWANPPFSAASSLRSCSVASIIPFPLAQPLQIFQQPPAAVPHGTRMELCSKTIPRTSRSCFNAFGNLEPQSRIAAPSQHLWDFRVRRRAKAFCQLPCGSTKSTNARAANTLWTFPCRTSSVYEDVFGKTSFRSSLVRNLFFLSLSPESGLISSFFASMFSRIKLYRPCLGDHWSHQT